ncbi:MAG: hypothetical protein ACK4JD_13650, partial [Thermoflexales bacterium]
MSLESQIAALVTASNALTSEVSGKITQINAALNNAINTIGIIDTPTTLEVGPGKPFATIQQAIDHLNGKILRANVTIKLSDGDHYANSIVIETQPYGGRISIVGNTVNPAACRIVWTPDSNGYSHGLIVSGSRVRVAGIKFIGSATDSHVTWRSLLAHKGGRIDASGGDVIIDGGVYGAEAYFNSMAYVDGISITGCVSS